MVRADDPGAVERLRQALGRPVDEAPLVLVAAHHKQAFADGQSIGAALNYGTVAPVIPADLAAGLAGGTGKDGRGRLALVEPDTVLGTWLTAIEAAGGHGLVAFPLARNDEPGLVSVARVRQLGEAVGVPVAAGRVA